jgi:predicted transcriptional regulator
MRKDEVHIGLVIDKATQKRLQGIAKQYSVSFSAVVRWAIARYLGQNEAPPADRRGSK